jgi:hypothetical protein
MNPSWPCKNCSHRLDEHDYSGDSIHNPGYLGQCKVVTFRMNSFQLIGDTFIQTCKCFQYKLSSNLEFLEKQYETNQYS